MAMNSKGSFKVFVAFRDTMGVLMSTKVCLKQIIRNPLVLENPNHNPEISQESPSLEVVSLQRNDHRGFPLAALDVPSCALKVTGHADAQ